MTRAPSIGESVSGDSIPINVERLIETRLLITANSGAGKSWALRRLLEQTHGQVQQIVIDVEDEFATLREKFDYVLAGRQGGDCPADTRCAALLARRLLELGVSAIIGIYELKAHDRVRFVRLFLESLIDAPKELWHPVMVVIDEAHMFAPENGKAESTQAVIDLATRGRKRGFCIVPATQRPAMLAKDVSAQCNNKLVGRFSQDIDVKRAADDIGFYRRDQQAALRSLKPGSFFAVGPALCDAVTEVTVGPVMTTHPRAGQRALAPPPPKDNVRQVLAKLADLPAEAERDAQTVADLQRKVRELEAELRKQPNITAEVSKIEANVRQQYGAKLGQFRKAALHSLEGIAAIQDNCKLLHNALQGVADETLEVHAVTAPVAVNVIVDRKENEKACKVFAEHSLSRNGRDDSADSRVLRALAMIHPQPGTKRRIGVLSGVNPKKSTWRAAMALLKQQGAISVDGDSIELTEQGLAWAHSLGEITPEDRISMWREKFDSGANRIFEVLLSAGAALDKRELGELSGIDPKLSTWRAAMAQIRASGFLIEDSRGFSIDRDLLEGV